MKINKYLKELGLEQEDMPGYYNPNCENTDKAAYDPRNEEDEEGFCTYEFFNLDYNLSLHIYSRLCYFREHIASMVTPGFLSPNDYSSEDSEKRRLQKEAAHNKWISIIDKMIEGFRIRIVGPREGYEGIDRQKFREGLQLFIDYYECLWY